MANAWCFVHSSLPNFFHVCENNYVTFDMHFGANIKNLEKVCFDCSIVVVSSIESFEVQDEMQPECKVCVC